MKDESGGKEEKDLQQQGKASHRTERERESVCVASGSVVQLTGDK